MVLRPVDFAKPEVILFEDVSYLLDEEFSSTSQHPYARARMKLSKLMSVEYFDQLLGLVHTREPVKIFFFTIVNLFVYFICYIMVIAQHTTSHAPTLTYLDKGKAQCPSYALTLCSFSWPTAA